MAKIVYRQMPAPRELSQQIPAPGQKLGCKIPRVRANFWCKFPGVRREVWLWMKSIPVLRVLQGCLTGIAHTLYRVIMVITARPVSDCLHWHQCTDIWLTLLLFWWSFANGCLKPSFPSCHRFHFCGMKCNISSYYMTMWNTASQTANSEI